MADLETSASAPIRPGCCYETAMTRKFYHGRTETMRPCTVEAVKWCAAMTEPSCDVCGCWGAVVDGDQSGTLTQSGFLFQDDAKRKAMMLAFEKHNKLMAEAQDGHGELVGLTFLFFVSLKGSVGFWVFHVTSVQALTGTFWACIWSPKRRDVRLQNSS